MNRPDSTGPQGPTSPQKNSNNGKPLEAEKNEFFQGTAQTVRLILPLFSRFKVPFTPENYRLGYEYFVGESDGLREELDRIFASGEELTPEKANRLLRDYLEPAADNQVRLLETMGDKLQSLVVDLVKNTLQSVARSKTYTRELQKQLQQIDACQTMDQVASLLLKIVHETDDVIRSNESYQANLGQSTQEINRLREELKRSRELARIDELTALSNRRGFEDRLRAEMAKVERRGGTLSVAILDLDDFKEVNDTHGHLIGDRLLTILAQLIRESVREMDFPARIGGEEFGVIFPETGLEEGFKGAERIRLSVQETDFIAKGAPIHITISAGLAAFRPGESREDFLERADQALYQSKREGKNRTSCDPEG